MTTERECLDTLHEATRELGESPSKGPYEALGLTPASSTIVRTLGGWNVAKERAGLETVTPRGGTGIEPPPEDVDADVQARWTELSVDRRWHYRNVARNAERTRRRRASLRADVADRRAEAGCVRCGESDPVCLDFHHLDPETKERTVSELVTYGASRRRLDEEIADCRVPRANCHNAEHDETSALDHWVDATGDSLPLEAPVPTADLSRLADSSLTKAERLRAWSYAYEHSRGCRCCGETDPIRFESHHTNDDKRMGVGLMIAYSRPTRDVLAEVEKCVVLCTNCPRRVHG